MAVRDIFGRPAMPRRLVICTGPCCDHSGKASVLLQDLRGLLSLRAVRAHEIEKGCCVRRSCLGKCSGEPLAHVQPDDVWYRDLSPERLLRIYEQHVLGGEAVPELILAEKA
jgi:(2Fe-2S) ferredoxin